MTFVQNNLPVLSVIATVILSYLAGSIPFGFLIGKMKGIDIREHGSGNIGATNVTRVVGKWWGKGCFFCDFLKSALPVTLVIFLCRKGCFADPWGLLPSLAAFCAVAGHIFPVWLKFKGGKGISTAAGAVLAVVKHISNIKRLLNGTESRFTKKKDREEKEEK